MAKRFITTGLFEDAWFMDLPSKYKLFWIYLITNCDHAGIWQVNYKLASFYCGDHMEPGECERFLKDRFVKLNEGKYWFLPKFIEFQYGLELNKTNRAVSSVIEILKKNNLSEFIPKVKIIEGAKKGLSRSYLALKDKDKDKDKDKVKTVINAWNDFAKKYNLSQLVKLTDAREKKIKKRLSEAEFDFNLILSRISESKFLLGENQNGWKVDFDFIIWKEENYIKIIERKYNNGSGSTNSQSAKHPGGSKSGIPPENYKPGAEPQQI